MTDTPKHDPLCTYAAEWESMGRNSGDCPECELIACVRADERELTIATIVALPGEQRVYRIDLIRILRSADSMHSSIAERDAIALHHLDGGERQ